MRGLISRLTRKKSTEPARDYTDYQRITGSRDAVPKIPAQAAVDQTAQYSIKENLPAQPSLAELHAWKRQARRSKKTGQEDNADECGKTDANESGKIDANEGDKTDIIKVTRKPLNKQHTPLPEPISNEPTPRKVEGTDDRRVYSLFQNWLAKQEPPVKYQPNVYSEEPWRSLAAQAWVFGHHLDAKKFTHYALSQFLVNCALVELSTWEFIESRTEADSTLRRFSNHWIAWNVSLAQTEYASLKAAALVNQVTENTRDPRRYDLEHWSSSCGDDIGSTCDHNVGIKKIACNSPRREYPETGRDWELAQNDKPVSSTSQKRNTRPSKQPIPPRAATPSQPHRPATPKYPSFTSVKSSKSSTASNSRVPTKKTTS